jgi:prepilin-type N-terminal cleavage/methylation domain-containing protein
VSRRADAGFTFIELAVVVGLLGVLMAITVPTVLDISGDIKLRNAMREVERELQTARLKAVTANRPIRVRFNCPAAGQYRMVELLGSAGAPLTNDADSAAATRCSQGSYPFPPSDVNPLTTPNHDGPVKLLPNQVTFGTAPAVEFWPDGSAHMADGAEVPWPVIPTSGTTVTVRLTRNNVTITKTVLINGLGRITLQR